MHSTERSSWVTHDFKVKMLEWSAFRGSHLAHTCRRCGRACRLFTLLRQGTWAVDGEGCALEDAVTDRWLSEDCPRHYSASDHEDRKRRRDSLIG